MVSALIKYAVAFQDIGHKLKNWDKQDKLSCGHKAKHWLEQSLLQRWLPREAALKRVF